MKKNLLIFLLMLYASVTNAQNGTWYFGNDASILFGTAPNNNPPDIAASEGTAIVYGEDGTVIFYTNGISVMNGADAFQFGGLQGHTNSCQNVVVVPSLCEASCGRYFIFTVDAAENDFANGWRVTQVEVTGTPPNTTVTLVSGQVNTEIDLPTGAIVGEKITVVPDDDDGYWVVTHGIELQDYSNNCYGGYCNYGDYYFTVHVTDGTCGTEDFEAVGQQIGANVVSGCVPFGAACPVGPNYKKNAEGQLKFNQQYDMSAMAIHSDKVIQITDFDNGNGVFTNAKQVNIDNCYSGNTLGYVYGIEFSPDGQVLYATSTHEDVGEEWIMQFSNLTQSAASICGTINAFSIFDDTDFNDEFELNLGALQLAPDGHIYMARAGDNEIGDVQNPNNMGSGGLLFFDYTLPTGTSMIGLPQCLESKYVPAPTVDLGPDLEVCEFPVLLDAGPGFSGYDWTQPGSCFNFSQLMFACEEGEYSVTVTDVNGCTATDEVEIELTIPEPNILATATDVECGTLVIIFVDNCPDCTYLWSDNSTGGGIAVTPMTTTTYTVTVTNAQGCTAVESITINVTCPADFCLHIDNVGNNDVGRNVIATSDGGCIVVGNLSNVGTNQDMYVIKYDNAMVEEFSTRIGELGSGITIEQAYSVVTSPTGYYVLGTSQISQTNTDIVVFKLSLQGALLGSTRLSSTIGAGMDYGRKILLISSNPERLMVVGHSNGFSANNDIYIFALGYNSQTNNFIIGGAKAIGGATSATSEVANDAILSSDNAFIFIAGTTTTGTNSDMFMVRVTLSNLAVFSRKNGHPLGREEAISIVQIGNDLYFAGSTTTAAWGPAGSGQNIYILKTNTAFQASANVVLSSPGATGEFATSIIRNAENHLVLAGSNSNTRGIIMEINPSPSMSVIWSKNSLLPDDYAYNSVAQLTNGRYVVTGQYTQVNDLEMLVGFVAEEEGTCCNELVGYNPPTFGALVADYGAPLPATVFMQGKVLESPGVPFNIICDEGERIGEGNGINNNSSLLVYPNPNNGTFTLSVPELEEEIISLTVSDFTGKLVKQIQSPQFADGKIQLNMPGLYAGLYIVQVKTPSQQFTTRVSINK